MRTYKIVPKNTKWVVLTGVFPFQGYLSTYGTFKYLGFGFGDFDNPCYFDTPEDAKEGMKRCILLTGNKISHYKQHMKKVKENESKPTIVIPPWK